MSLMVASLASTSYAQSMLCIQYQRTDGTWSHTQSLPYVIVKGSFLNKNLIFPQYNHAQKYAVAMWPNKTHSAFELPYFLDDIDGQRYEYAFDQEGRMFRIRNKKNRTVCP